MCIFDMGLIIIADTAHNADCSLGSNPLYNSDVLLFCSFAKAAEQIIIKIVATKVFVSLNSILVDTPA